MTIKIEHTRRVLGEVFLWRQFPVKPGLDLTTAVTVLARKGITPRQTNQLKSILIKAGLNKGIIDLSRIGFQSMNDGRPPLNKDIGNFIRNFTYRIFGQRTFKILFDNSRLLENLIEKREGDPTVLFAIVGRLGKWSEVFDRRFPLECYFWLPGSSESFWRMSEMRWPFPNIQPEEIRGFSAADVYHMNWQIDKLTPEMLQTMGEEQLRGFTSEHIHTLGEKQYLSHMLDWQIAFLFTNMKDPGREALLNYLDPEAKKALEINLAV